MGDLDASKSEILDSPSPNLDPKSQIWIQDTDSGLESGPGSGPQIEVQIQVQRGSQRRGTMVSECVESVYCASKHRKYKNAQNEILDVRF